MIEIEFFLFYLWLLSKKLSHLPRDKSFWHSLSNRCKSFDLLLRRPGKDVCWICDKLIEDKNKILTDKKLNE